MCLTGCEECSFDSIKTEELPIAHMRSEYYAKIETSQSCTPYSKYFTVTKGSLPEGLKINDDGEIKGTPERQGTWEFTVTVEICFAFKDGFDSDCHAKRADFEIEVVPY